MIKTQNQSADRAISWMAAAAFAFLTGCAGTQLPGQNPSTQGQGGVENDRVAGAAAETVAEPTAAAVTAKSSGPARSISDDQKADFTKATATYQKLRKAGPLSGSACDEAASAFRRAADDNPSLVEARHNEASVYLECGKSEEAARIWEKLAGQRYAPALTSLGFLAWQKGDSGQAESYFTRAIDADKQLGSVAARINLAQILRDRARKSGKIDMALANQAILHLRTVLALDGNNLQAYANLCFLYYDLGYLEMARLVGDQAVNRAREIATGTFEEERADTGSDKGKKGKAKKDVEETKVSKEVASGEGTGYTTEMKRHLAIVYNTMGLVWLKRKSVSEAIASFKKAIDNDPKLNEARMNLAALALNFRDYPTAEANFRAVLAAQPKNYEAIIGLGVALRGGRKVDDAEAQYLSAQKLDPQNPASYFNLGLLYQDYKGGDKPTLQKAQQYYRDFLGHASSGATAQQRKDAGKRIKDIDELFVALEDAAKLQKEADEIQRKDAEQQRKNEEELKKMQEQEKKAGASATTPPPAAAAGAPKAPAGGLAPPPLSK